LKTDAPWHCTTPLTTPRLFLSRIFTESDVWYRGERRLGGSGMLCALHAIAGGDDAAACRCDVKLSAGHLLPRWIWIFLPYAPVGVTGCSRCCAIRLRVAGRAVHGSAVATTSRHPRNERRRKSKMAGQSAWAVRLWAVEEWRKDGELSFDIFVWPRASAGSLDRRFSTSQNAV